MKDEINRIYKVPKEKITTIATDPELWIEEILKLYNRVARTKNEDKLSVMMLSWSIRQES